MSIFLLLGFWLLLQTKLTFSHFSPAVAVSIFATKKDYSRLHLLKLRGGKTGVERQNTYLGGVVSSSSKSDLSPSRPVLRLLLIFCTFCMAAATFRQIYMQNRVDVVIVTTLRFFAGLICFLPVFLRFEARKDVVLGGLEIGFCML